MAHVFPTSVVVTSGVARSDACSTKDIKVESRNEIWNNCIFHLLSKWYVGAHLWHVRLLFSLNTHIAMELQKHVIILYRWCPEVYKCMNGLFSAERSVGMVNLCSWGALKSPCALSLKSVSEENVDDTVSCQKKSKKKRIQQASFLPRSSTLHSHVRRPPTAVPGRLLRDRRNGTQKGSRRYPSPTLFLGTWQLFHSTRRKGF